MCTKISRRCIGNRGSRGYSVAILLDHYLLPTKPARRSDSDNIRRDCDISCLVSRNRWCHSLIENIVAGSNMFTRVGPLRLVNVPKITQDISIGKVYYSRTPRASLKQKLLNNKDGIILISIPNQISYWRNVHAILYRTAEIWGDKTAILVFT